MKTCTKNQWNNRCNKCMFYGFVERIHEQGCRMGVNAIWEDDKIQHRCYSFFSYEKACEIFEAIGSLIK